MISFVNFLLRVACALAFGIILLLHDDAATLVLRGAGWLFGLAGLIGLASDAIDSLRGRQTIVPFASYGSIIAGILMLAYTDDLVPYVPIILGALLILDCSNQIFNLLGLKFRTSVRSSYFITPAIVLTYGIFLTFQHRVNALVGLSFLLFTASEIAITIAYFKYLYLNKSDRDEAAESATATTATDGTTVTTALASETADEATEGNQQ